MDLDLFVCHWTQVYVTEKLCRGSFYKSSPLTKPHSRAVLLPTVFPRQFSVSCLIDKAALIAASNHRFLTLSFFKKNLDVAFSGFENLQLLSAILLILVRTYRSL